MLIQNNTYKVDPGIVSEWYRWQREVCIPEIMKTGLFSEYRCYELLDMEETDGKTYVIQFWAKDKKDHDRFVREYDRDFEKWSLDNWGHRIVRF
ncbi:MAG: DUF4286 family protein, partial [Bacteroidota bacterium]|nr:DUF4286 family protein [Bacteroidota bacterium]